MNTSPIPIGPRIVLYDHYKDRRRAYQEAAFNLLGGKCQLCASTENLRHRFIDRAHPLATRYRTNPATLFRRISLEPSLREALHLLCRECRLSIRISKESISNSTNQGHSLLDGPTTMEVTSDRIN